MEERGSLKAYLASVKHEMDLRLDAAYPASRQNPCERTTEAMRYMLFLGGGGKRVRPALAILAAEGCGGSRDAAWSYAQAVEEIHTYSLIIDDIQDKSEVRRNGTACHVRFGVDTALLAGMRLYERGLRPFHAIRGVDCEEILNLLDLLHRGQAADLESGSWPHGDLTLDRLRFIHSAKTSALMQLALLGAAHAVGASGEQKKCLKAYGYYLGLAFQAADDILSAASTCEAIGKPAGFGSDAGRLTYPRVFGGIEAAQTEARRLASEACGCLTVAFRERDLLHQFAHFAVERHC